MTRIFTVSTVTDTDLASELNDMIDELRTDGEEIDPAFRIEADRIPDEAMTEFADWVHEWDMANTDRGSDEVWDCWTNHHYELIEWYAVRTVLGW